MSRSFYHRWEAQISQAVLWHLTIFARKMPEAGAAVGSSGGRSTTTDELPRGTTDSRGFLSRDLLYILSNHEAFGLTGGVWYAIDAPDAMVVSHPAHTLAGRLGLSAETLTTLAEAAGLFTRGGAKSVTKLLNATTTQVPRLQLSLARPYIGGIRVRHALHPHKPTERLTTQQNNAHAAKRERRPRRSRVPSSSAARLDRPR